MNKVIAREYVEKNYIHKDIIKEKIKNREISINDIQDNLEINEGMILEIKRLENEIDLYKELLEETNGGINGRNVV